VYINGSKAGAQRPEKLLTMEDEVLCYGICDALVLSFFGKRLRDEATGCGVDGAADAEGS
jgi:hypothetical protein